MTLRDYIRFQYAYNNWANTRLLDTCDALTQEQFLAGQGFSTANPSIRDTLVHILSAQEVWLSRWNGVSPTRVLDPHDFGTVALVRDYWRQVEGHTQGYVERVQDDVLDKVMEYTNTKGLAFAYPRWQTMVHQVNHATQHRAETALLLTRLGHSPGELDVLAYMDTVRVRR